MTTTLRTLPMPIWAAFDSASEFVVSRPIEMLATLIETPRTKAAISWQTFCARCFASIAMAGAGPSPAYPMQVTSSSFVSDCVNRFSLRTCSGESRALNGANGCTTNCFVTSTIGCCTATCDSFAMGTVVLVLELVLVLVLGATVAVAVAVV